MGFTRDARAKARTRLTPWALHLRLSSVASPSQSLDELAYWITFDRVSGIGPVSFKSLLEYFDNDLEAAWRADTKELAQAGLTRNTIENVMKLRTTSTPQRELEKLEKLRIRVITWKDKNYPPLLRIRDVMHLD